MPSKAGRHRQSKRTADQVAGAVAADSDGEAAARPDETPAAAAVDQQDTGPSERATLEAELAEAKDRVLRERAELENFKKRVVRERAELIRFGGEALLRDLLPIIDNLERALEQAREADPLVEGIELVLRSMREALGRHGAKAMDVAGAMFDPAFHEAIGHVESEQAANVILEEHQRGYLLHDRLLRPSVVTVSKGPAPAAPAATVAKADDDG